MIKEHAVAVALAMREKGAAENDLFDRLAADGRLSLTRAEDGTTVIRGPIVDQAALHGVLQKLRDIGVPLVSVTQLRTEGE